ncbi:MAG: MFS transporter [Erysipelotrichaceae bacterium]|nr:MFS transporter [Erysipelotrichaceae bacterium]
MKRSELKDFYLLWSSQGLSQLGSSVTSFALTLWIYQKTGSALQTAILAISSYAPYVIMSIFAGALSDRWNKKRTMLVCDLLAACATIAVFFMIRYDLLEIWHLYLINALSGLMNTIQGPASEVAITLVTPKEYYQKVSGMMSFSRSLISIMHPMIASSLYAFAGIDPVIYFDLITFAVAFIVLLLFIDIPEDDLKHDDDIDLLGSVKQGLRCLNENRVVLWLILFLSGVNLVASMFDAALPAYILPHKAGGEKIYGIVTSAAGVAMLLGSITVSLLPAPKDRVRVILLTMLFSLTTDNFLISVTSSVWLWCLAQFLGYFPVTIMSSNLEVIIRSLIPKEMQGRVYACRNTFQFFTIPIGYYLGGWLTDEVMEPFMSSLEKDHLFLKMFGEGKGSGAGMLLFLLGIAAIFLCSFFGRILRKYHFSDQ